MYRKKLTLGDRLKILEENELVEIKELIKPAWTKGQRQFLALYLSGWMARAKVHPVSVAKLFKLIVEEIGDDELEQRLSTIYYSYKRVYGDVEELSELDSLIEEWKAQGILRRRVSKGVNVRKKKIKGRFGVQEILENTMGEERALEVLRAISDILKYGGKQLNLLMFHSK